jgi:hypothetical protein
VLRRFVTQPFAALEAVYRVSGQDWRTVAAGSVEAASAYSEELDRLGIVEELGDRLSRAFAGLDNVTVRGRTAVPGGMRALHLKALWVLVRSRMPAVVVETGVCNGLSSAVLLAALCRNAGGDALYRSIFLSSPTPR